MLGFLESISNSDSDSLPGCLIHLWPLYSCNSTGGKSHSSGGFGKDLLAAPYKNLGRRAGSPFLPPTANVAPPRKESSVYTLCSDICWQARDCLPFRTLTCSQVSSDIAEKQVAPLTFCLDKTAFLHKKPQIIWQSLRLNVFAQGHFWALWRDLLTSLPC